MTGDDDERRSSGSPPAVPDESPSRVPDESPSGQLRASPDEFPPPPDAPPDAAELQLGRMLVRTNLWRIVWVAVVVHMIAGGAPDANVPATVARLVMIGLTAWLVYRGLRWALWLLGALTVLAGVFMVVVALVTPALDWTLRALFAVAGAAQVFAFLVLVKAPEVRAFMQAQRDAASARGKRGGG